MKRVQFDITEKSLKRIDNICSKEGITRSALVKKSLTLYEVITKILDTGSELYEKTKKEELVRLEFVNFRN